MIAFVIYSIVIVLLIYQNGFFKLFTDDKLSRKTFSLFFLLKILAIPFFYFLFMRISPGGQKLDAAKFFSDATVMNYLAYKEPLEYVKMLFGFQDDSIGSRFYNTCIVLTDNWDNGEMRDFFYNDNRVVIRFHSLIHFIAFKSFFVHALFNCFFSFIGITLIYKAIKQYFIGKEMVLMIILCLFPSLWLYTGGVLKEGWVIFFMGSIIYNLKLIFENGLSVKRINSLLVLTFISLILKPYLLFYALVYFGLYFMVKRYYHGKKPLVVFFSIIILALIAMNLFSIGFNKRSLTKVALDREREFADLAKGGIFLLDSSKFVRLSYNHELIKNVPGKSKYFTIKKNVPYIYWEHQHQNDTLFCASNSDTLTQYSLVYELPTAGSNIDVVKGSSNIIAIGIRSLYYTVAHPLFFNAKGVMQIFASFENLLLLLSILIILIHVLKAQNNLFFPLILFLFGISIFVLIGITTPNSGAIMRYRSPAAIFIVCAAWYFINKPLNKLFQKSN